MDQHPSEKPQGRGSPLVDSSLQLIQIGVLQLCGACRQVAPQLKTQGICNVCWALTMLRVPPPRDVAELLMVEAQVGVGGMRRALLNE
eukprot:1154536-Pelagomonas_calceolata.AAC.1